MVQIWRKPSPAVGLAYVTDHVCPGEYVTVPDGRCGLAWADGRVWWMGPATRPWIAEHEREAVVGIRFEHVAGRVFAGCSLRPWADARVELHGLPNMEQVANALMEQMRQAKSTNDQAQALTSLATNHVRGIAVDPISVEILNAAERSEPIAETSLRVGLSSRQLHRRCVDSFGMAPTTLRRVLRLHVAASARAGTPGISLAEVATQAGFSDQSHLTREVADLTLVSPSVALL